MPSDESTSSLDNSATTTPASTLDPLEYAEQLAREFATTDVGRELLSVLLTSRQLYQLARERLHDILDGRQAEYLEETEMLLVRSMAMKANEQPQPEHLLAGLTGALQWAGQELIRPRGDQPPQPVETPWGRLRPDRSVLLLGWPDDVRAGLLLLTKTLLEHVPQGQVQSLIGMGPEMLTPQDAWMELCPHGYLVMPKHWHGCADRRARPACLRKELGVLVVEDLAQACQSGPTTRHQFLRAGTAHQRLRLHARGAFLLGGLVEDPSDENIRWCRELFQAHADVWRVRQADGLLKLEVGERQVYEIALREAVDACSV